MSEKEQLRQAIRQIVRDMIPVPFAWARVKSVDKEAKTAVCIDTIAELEYYDVLLGLGSVLPVPTTDTRVLLGITGGTGEASFILWAQQVDEYLIAVENGFNLSLNSDGTMTINGDSCGGLPITPKLKEQLEKMTKRIDSAFDLLKQVPSGALHPNTGAWTGIYEPIVASLEKEDFSEIENEKIKHGN